MSIYNPFASYQIAVPKKYSDLIKQYCKQSNSQDNMAFTPFNRQVDFWYFSFLYASKHELDLQYYASNDLTNITAASILSNHHIIHMQMAYLAKCSDIDDLDNSKTIFDHISQLAYAGIPHVLNILKDRDNDTPLFNILDAIEEATKD